MRSFLFRGHQVAVPWVLLLRVIPQLTPMLTGMRCKFLSRNRTQIAALMNSKQSLSPTWFFWTCVGATGLTAATPRHGHCCRASGQGVFGSTENPRREGSGTDFPNGMGAIDRTPARNAQQAHTKPCRKTAVSSCDNAVTGQELLKTHILRHGRGTRGEFYQINLQSILGKAETRRAYCPGSDFQTWGDWPINWPRQAQLSLPEKNGDCERNLFLAKIHGPCADWPLQGPPKYWRVGRPLRR